jgi:signal transduction histidine kinase
MERDVASARRMIGELEGEVDDCLDDVRSLGAGIYPSLLAQCGLAEALRSLARRSSIAARVAIDGTDRYRTEVEAAVYFCCSEALQNAAKHGDRSTAVSISLERHADLRFEVRDDGPGFSPPHVRAGQGLANMRDRIEAVGGTLDIRSSPGHGTSVIGSIASP